MAYHNRKPLILKTLEILEKYPKKNFEVVIVDDASEERHRLEDELDYSFEIILIRIKPEHKTHVNPCIPFNIGFEHARGEKIIIQNPECLHAGDLISAASAIKENEYIPFHCYSFDARLTQRLFDLDISSLSFDDLTTKLKKDLSSLPQQSCDQGVYAPAWFNHSDIRPIGYHFASAIMAKDLRELGGFDERYAMGIGWDDDEILERIKRKGMNINFCDETVIHQWHHTAAYHNPNFQSCWARNQNLFNNVTKNETEWRVESRVNK